MSVENLEQKKDELRLAVYRHVVTTGHAPNHAVLARSLHLDRETVGVILETLEQERVLVLDPATREIRKAMPFSAIPTNYRVIAGESRWWAN